MTKVARTTEGPKKAVWTCTGNWRGRRCQPCWRQRSAACFARERSVPAAVACRLSSGDSRCRLEHQPNRPHRKPARRAGTNRNAGRADGRARPDRLRTGARRLHRPPPTASAHLTQRLDAQWLRATVSGRHRCFRLASPEIAKLLETLMRLAAQTADFPAPRLMPTLHGLERAVDVTPSGQTALQPWLGPEHWIHPAVVSRRTRRGTAIGLRPGGRFLAGSGQGVGRCGADHATARDDGLHACTDSLRQRRLGLAGNPLPLLFAPAMLIRP